MARKRLAGWALVLGLWASTLSGNALAVLPQFEQPGWVALTPEQRTILAPLEKDWGEMDAFRRKKWLGIAQRYPAMSPAEQDSMHRNMQEWARLAPEERKVAREKYKTLKKFAPEDRQVVKQKWEEYSTLTEEEKERLRKKAPLRPKVKTPTTPPAAVPPDKRVATPPVPAPRSPISPRKPPQSPLVPPGNRPPVTIPSENLNPG